MAFGWLAARPLGFGLPPRMRVADLLVIGCVAAIGFTVSLFIAAVAFDPGPVQDAAKMGALMSFAPPSPSGVERQRARLRSTARSGSRRADPAEAPPHRRQAPPPIGVSRPSHCVYP
jgi:hypothetical protein